MNNRLIKIIQEEFTKKEEKFIAGQSRILTGMAVYDEKEVLAILEVLMEGKLGLSVRGKKFEKRFSKYIDVSYTTLVNSGSSATLLALSSLKERFHLNEGEIITPACGFSTTVNPIFQLGFKPVFIDIDSSYNINKELINNALTPHTKGIVFAHTLGNPAQIDEIMKIANEKNIFVLEDCCDAYGSIYKGKKCGSFGTVSTYSFYPAHNITLAGEGGALTTDDPKINNISKSLRDWGRDCCCEAGQDNRCGKRFEYLINNVPYDHKYIFARKGYNLKPIEMQAAMGLVQLKRIDRFNVLRRRNFEYLKNIFLEMDDFFCLPKINEGADPVFFGFPIRIKEPKINRKDLIQFLNKNKIETRYFFGGNLLYHPAYKNESFTVVGNLDYTDDILKNHLWIGIHPGINTKALDYVGEKFNEYISIHIK